MQKRKLKNDLINIHIKLPRYIVDDLYFGAYGDFLEVNGLCKEDCNFEFFLSSMLFQCFDDLLKERNEKNND